MSEEVPNKLIRWGPSPADDYFSVRSWPEKLNELLSNIPAGRAAYPESIEEDVSSRSTGLGAYEDYLSYSPIPSNRGVENTSDPFQALESYEAPYYEENRLAEYVGDLEVPVDLSKVLYPVEGRPDPTGAAYAGPSGLSFQEYAQPRSLPRISEGLRPEDVFPDTATDITRPSFSETYTDFSTEGASPFFQIKHQQAQPIPTQELYEELYEEGSDEDPLIKKYAPDLYARTADTRYSVEGAPELTYSNSALPPEMPDAIKQLKNTNSRRRRWVEDNVISRQDYVSYVDRVGQEKNLPPNFLATLHLIESSFDPYATPATSSALGGAQFIGNSPGYTHVSQVIRDRPMGVRGKANWAKFLGVIPPERRPDGSYAPIDYTNLKYQPIDRRRSTFGIYGSTAGQYGLIYIDREGNIIDKRTDFAASADAAARLAVDSTNQIRSAFGRDPEPYELYMYHQQGATQAERVLKAAQNRPNANLYNIYVNELGISPSRARDMLVNNKGTVEDTAAEFVSKWKNDYAAAERLLLDRVKGLGFLERSSARDVAPFEVENPYKDPTQFARDVARMDVLYEPELAAIMAQQTVPDERGLYQAFRDRLRGDISTFQGPYAEDLYAPVEGAYSPYIPEDRAELRDPRSTAIYGEDPTFGQRLVELGYDPSLQGTPAGRPNLPTAQELIEARGDVLTTMSGAQQYGIETQQRARNFFGTMGRLFGRQDEVARDDRNRAAGLAIMRQAGLRDVDIAYLAATADDLVLQQLQRVMEGVADPESGIGLDLYEDRFGASQRQLRQERLARRRNRPQIEAEEGVGSLF